MNNEIETINVGIFGHIDHGKTTLLEKLSGRWASTHSEELKRGITIKLGYADATIYKEGQNYNIKKIGKPVRHVSFIDSPGHEMLMATTLSGATLIDAAILVIAANEGIKPQTREHLMVLQAKKIKHLIVVQNKIDLVDIEKAKQNYKEIKKFLEKAFPDTKIIPSSAQQEVNIDEILKAICEIPIPKRELESDPIFLIARSFDVNKPGTAPEKLVGAVLGGTLKKGRLKIGDVIEIKPGIAVKEGEIKKYHSLKTKISNLYRGSEKVKELAPGGSMSIATELDMSTGKRDALSGNVVSLVNKLPPPSYEVKLKYSLFPKIFGISNEMGVEKIKKGETLMLNINTSITGGIIESASEDEIKLALKVPVVLFKKDLTGIARNIQGHWRLVGYGEVI